MGTGVEQGVRRCMAPMHPRMLLMSVACVTARPSAVLDVCVLLPRCCASVAVVMSSAAVRCAVDHALNNQHGTMRLVLCPPCSHGDSQAAGGRRPQRAASRGAQSAE